MQPNNAWMWRGKPLLVAWVLMALQPAIAAEALTLDNYFSQALARSEVVSIQGELVQQAQERKRQASAALYPTLTGYASYTWQETGTRNLTLYPIRQRLARLTANQPLFRGFREFAAVRQSRALVGAQDDDYWHARVQLFKDVAQNFYQVLAIEQDLVSLGEQIDQYQQRTKELQGRVRIGRSRSGEVLTVQSGISTLDAQIEQRKADLGTAREVFAFLSGLPVTTPLHDTEMVPMHPGMADEYLARIPLRPDVKAMQQRQTAAQENVTVARGAHLPSLDLNANRYLERNGILENVDWDVQLALTVPIYAGGGVQSRVREALSQNTQAELSLNQMRRQAEQEIRSIHQNVIFDRSQLDALQKATDAAQKNYSAQQRDYRLGLVTNLDVLQAQANFQENQRALYRVRYNIKLNYLRLQAAAVYRPEVYTGAAP